MHIVVNVNSTDRFSNDDLLNHKKIVSHEAEPEFFSDELLPDSLKWVETTLVEKTEVSIPADFDTNFTQNARRGGKNPKFKDIQRSIQNFGYKLKHVAIAVFRDEDGKKLDEATCSAINHQKYYSGEFDIEWGQTINENTFDWKKEEMDNFRKWLKLNDYDWEDPKLALGYIKIGQVDMKLGFQNKPFREVYNIMKNNLNITSIHTIGLRSWENEYPYTLDSDNWKQIQMEGLKKGYESHSLR